MIRCVAVALAAAALLGLAAELALGARPPSERRCLLAWNAPDNAANRRRVVAEGPWPRATLLPAVSGTIVWQRGSKPLGTSGPACVLTLVRHTRLQPVIGRWRNGRVPHWSFGRDLTTNNAPGRTNVRVFSDGRVTKVYLR